MLELEKKLVGLRSYVVHRQDEADFLSECISHLVTPVSIIRSRNK